MKPTAHRKSSPKLFVPKEELTHALFAKAAEGTKYMVETFGSLWATLAIKLVGIADDLLFKGLGTIVTRGQRKLALKDLFGSESCTCMTLADSRMAR